MRSIGEVSSAACANGTWTPKAEELTGVIYVPCSVLVTDTGLSATVTIAAEGSVKVEASAAVLKPAARRGALVLAGGDIKLTGSTQTLYCGAVGRSVLVSGSQFLLERGGPCAAASP